jgi:hypothetical protein
MLTISSQRLDRSRPAGRAYVSSHDNRDTEGTFNRGRIGNDKWASRQMDAAHLAGNSYMATRISLVEVPFATDTFLAYRRQLGNYASALRFLLRLRHFGNCPHNLFPGKLQRPPLVLGTFGLLRPRQARSLRRHKIVILMAVNGG